MVTSLTYKNECHLGINKILNLFKVVRVACFMYIHFEQLIFIKCTIEFFFSVRLSHQDFIYKCVFVCECVCVWMYAYASTNYTSAGWSPLRLVSVLY